MIWKRMVCLFAACSGLGIPLGKDRTAVAHARKPLAMSAKWRFSERRSAPDGIRKSPASATEGGVIAALKIGAEATPRQSQQQLQAGGPRISARAVFSNRTRRSCRGNSKRFDGRREVFLGDRTNLAAI
jgi:hypothetical protein